MQTKTYIFGSVAGGTGKTVVALNLLACLGLAGKKNLLVDTSPLGTLATLLRNSEWHGRPARDEPWARCPCHGESPTAQDSHQVKGAAERVCLKSSGLAPFRCYAADASGMGILPMISHGRDARATGECVHAASDDSTPSDLARALENLRKNRDREVPSTERAASRDVGVNAATTSSVSAGETGPAGHVTAAASETKPGSPAAAAPAHGAGSRSFDPTPTLPASGEGASSPPACGGTKGGAAVSSPQPGQPNVQDAQAESYFLVDCASVTDLFFLQKELQGATTVVVISPTPWEVAQLEQLLNLRENMPEVKDDRCGAREEELAGPFRIVVSKFDASDAGHAKVLAETRARYASSLVKTVIPFDPALGRAFAAGKSVVLAEPAAPSAIACVRLARELFR